MVMTQKRNLATKATAVNATWGKRIDKILFVSTETNRTFPAISVGVRDGRKHLTSKSLRSFEFVYQHHFNDFHWFMKADDDTYVIVENLRHFLSDKNSSEPVVYGHLFRHYVRQGYNSGGAGYVLSREALRRLMSVSDDPSRCRQDGGAEDVELGRCLVAAGVAPGNTTDAAGRTRFHALAPKTYLIRGMVPDWLYRIEANGYVRLGPDGISDYPISFHYVSPEDMIIYDFLIYNTWLHGVKSPDMKYLKASNKNRLLDDGVNEDFMNLTCMRRFDCRKHGWNTRK